MIVNVKSLMTVIVATVLMLAVVIPITGAMASMSMEKGMTDNDVGDGFLMAKAGASADLTITNDDGTVKLYVTNGGTGRALTVDAETLAEGQVVFSDTFLVEAGASAFTLTCDQTIDLITGASGAYMTIKDGHWAYYSTGAPRTVNEIKELKELKELKEQKEQKEEAKDAPVPDQEGTFSYVLYPQDSGKWLHCSAPVNVDTGSNVYLAYNGLLASGTLASMTILLPEPVPGEDSATCQYAASGDTNSLTAVNISYNGNEVEATDGIVVPLQYTDGEKMGMTGVLVSLIPVVLIVGVIIAAVSMLMLRRSGGDL
ncbi:MAG: hypothetical protein J5485_04185 [Candidatus Methanomethylophilaceae archaeon]|nr:hypothetical protein [Candidatus Methanomethylophilaceae archaeon]